MIHRVTPAVLQDVEKSHYIALDIGVGIDQGVSHPGLPSEVDHSIDLFAVEELVDPLTVGQIETHKTIARIGVALRHSFRSQCRPVDARRCKPRKFQLRVIVVVEIVDADDLISLFHQCLDCG